MAQNVNAIDPGHRAHHARMRLESLFEVCRFTVACGRSRRSSGSSAARPKGLTHCVLATRRTLGFLNADTAAEVIHEALVLFLIA
jgi:hypothetical protein